MTPLMIVILAVMPLLIAASGFCSASETSLFGLTYNDRLQLRRLSPRAARSVARLLGSPRTLLVTILLANMSVNALIFVLTSVLVLESPNPVVSASLNVAMIVALILFGEVLPKLLAGGRRVVFCRVFGPAMLRLYQAAAPISFAVERFVIAPVSRLFAPPARRDATPGGELTVEDLGSFLELGTQQGAIDREEQSLIAQVIELGQRRVRDVMTPRVQIRWLPAGASPDEVAQLVRESGHRYLPVYNGSPDAEVTGILDARRYLAAWAAGATPRIPDHLFAARYVPEYARLDQLLEQFRHAGSEIALCVDEYGTIDGLISVSDIAARLVDVIGPDDETRAEEIQRGEREVGVHRLAGGEWNVPGRLGLHEFTELFDIDADRRASTVGGLVMGLLGRIPSAGDQVAFAGLLLTVDSMRRNVVERVIVARPRNDHPHAAPAPDAPRSTTDE